MADVPAAVVFKGALKPRDHEIRISGRGMSRSDELRLVDTLEAPAVSRLVLRGRPYFGG